MSRILAIDYGKKRSGIAVTDTLQMIANGLTTVPTHTLFDFIKNYIETEDVEKIIVGLPRQNSGEFSDNMKNITPFVNRVRKNLPQVNIEFYDEANQYSTFAFQGTTRGIMVGPDGTRFAAETRGRGRRVAGADLFAAAAAERRFRV